MKTSISHLFLVLSSLVWIGVVANEKPTCGFPKIIKKKDKGVFLWRKCFSNQWFLQTTGGKQPLTVTGTMVSDISDLNKNFTVKAAKRTVEGIDFIIKEGKQSACLSIDSPGDIPVYAGKNRVQLPKSFSLPSLKPCNGPLLEYLFDSSGYNVVTENTGEKDWAGKTVGSVSKYSYGISKSALYLDGTGENMMIPDSKNLRMKKYTLMAWVRYEDMSTEDFSYQIFQKFGAFWLNINRESRKAVTGGIFGCGTKLVKVLSDKPVPPSTWTHVATTNDRNTLKLYVNGELAGEAKLPTQKPYCANLAPLNIGSVLAEKAADSKGYFRGMMDTARVYDRALREDEIRAEMFRN